jgi:predicted negative regulator of RcsB-dependent stress response
MTYRDYNKIQQKQAKEFIKQLGLWFFIVLVLGFLYLLGRKFIGSPFFP